MTKALVRGSGGAKPPWNQNTSSFWKFNESCKYACILILIDTKSHRYLQFAWSRIIFPDFSLTFQKIIVFPWPFTDHTNSLTFSRFPWPVYRNPSSLHAGFSALLTLTICIEINKFRLLSSSKTSIQSGVETSAHTPECSGFHWANPHLKITRNPLQSLRCTKFDSRSRPQNFPFLQRLGVLSNTMLGQHKCLCKMISCSMWWL